ncbi:MAG TPA: hypothetical protein VF720_14515 [Candidatus Eisenbacteria bacterium]
MTRPRRLTGRCWRTSKNGGDWPEAEGATMVNHSGFVAGCFRSAPILQLVARLLLVVLSCGVLAACGEDDSSTDSVAIGGTDGRIYDSEYVARRFFWLEDLREPSQLPLDIQIALFKTTRDRADDNRNGFETFVVRGSLQGDDVGIVVSDEVRRLVLNGDYTVTDIRGVPGRVIALRERLLDNERLYASYFFGGGSTPESHVGTYWTSRSPEDDLRVQVVALQESDLGDNALPDEFIKPTLRLERRNIYDLQDNRINPEALRITIRAIDTADRSSKIDGLELLTAMGLDAYNNETHLSCFGGHATTSTRGPDGLVDDVWIDTRNGYLVFPDQRPFDPELSDIFDTSIGLVLNECRTRVIGWELVNPTSSLPGDESYRRVSMDKQDRERNPALYNRLRAKPDTRRYEITGTFELRPD